jgi:elongation factor P hydroxylase
MSDGRLTFAHTTAQSGIAYLSHWLVAAGNSTEIIT